MTRIAICAPGTPIASEDAARVEALAKAEFPKLQLDFHPQCFADGGHFAGPDEMRLGALLACAHSSADAVWFAKIADNAAHNRVTSVTPAPEPCAVRLFIMRRLHRLDNRVIAEKR